MCWRPSIVCILKFEQMISEAYLLAMDSGPTLLAKKKKSPPPLLIHLPKVLKKICLKKKNY